MNTKRHMQCLKTTKVQRSVTEGKILIQDCIVCPFPIEKTAMLKNISTHQTVKGIG